MVEDDGAGALAVDPSEVDIVGLDIGLPGVGGRDVCRAMRSRGWDGPVLFLTACDAVLDLLSGFSSGGDDYAVKPFHTAEVAARLRGLFRRVTVADVPDGGGARLRLELLAA
jgi:DNA-binding response OmpR family regulator